MKRKCFESIILFSSQTLIPTCFIMSQQEPFLILNDNNYHMLSLKQQNLIIKLQQIYLLAISLLGINIVYINQMSEIIPLFHELAAAIARSDIQRIKKILAHPDATKIVNTVDTEKRHSLFHAARIPNQDLAIHIITLLLDKGVNPFHKEDNQQTVLYYLAKQGKTTILQVLLSIFPYDLDDQDRYGQNPLYWAACYGQIRVAQLLIQYEVDVNHTDSNGQTCLFYAAREGWLQMCKFLVSKGCRFDLRDKNNKTPVHFAKSNKQYKVVQYFANLKETNISVQVVKQARMEQKVSKKKKVVERPEYTLKFLDQEGQLNRQDLEALYKDNSGWRQLAELILLPEQLEDLQVHTKKSEFLRIATQMVDAFLQRPDLQLFKQAVDLSVNIDYLQYAKPPLNLSLIKHKLNFDCYQNEKEFKKDVFLMCENWIQYEGAGCRYGMMARKFKKEFQQIFTREFRYS